jgi:hypothetical protein
MTGFFDTPFVIFEEKKFSSLRRHNEYCTEKVKDGRNRSVFRKTVFLLTGLNQKFIISNCGIQYYMGDENLRPVYKKPSFEILSAPSYLRRIRT